MDKILLKYMLKYGATGVMAAWLFTLNIRLTDVEQRLYNCLETRVKISNNHSVEDHPELVAILPRELKIKKHPSDE
jgi:hypothetical protein